MAAVRLFYYGDEIKEDEMVWARGVYGGEENCIQDFLGETWRKETAGKTWTYLGDIKMDLKQIGWERVDLCFGLATGGGLLWTR